MPQNSFATKQIRVTFTLTTGGTFDTPTPNGTAGNVLKLAGLRTLATVRGTGFPAWPDAELTIYGMRQSDMNALSSLAYNTEQISRNNVLIEADSGNGYSAIFSGQIVNGYIDYAGAPEVCFRVQARALYLQSLTSQGPLSFPGATDAAGIINQLAVSAGYSFENNGVNAQLSSPYYGGTVGDQINQIVKHIGCDMYIEGQVLAICPKGTPRATPSFTLTPDSGLVGYPLADARGYIQTRALFNTAFHFGGHITIAGSDVVLDPSGKTQLLNARANGNWYVGSIQHTLEAFKFGGAWFSDMLLQPLGSQPSATP
jgi:hypothetical protein